MRLIFYFLLIAGSINCTNNLYSKKYGEEGIQISSMDKEGIDSSRIHALDSAIEKGIYPNIHSLLIARNNKLVFEKYWPGMDKTRRGGELTMTIHGKDSLHNLASVTKSVVSACIGIAISRGKIKGINERVFDFFPEYARLDTGLRSSLTIRHLLTMSSGFVWTENMSYDSPENSSTGMLNSGNAIEFVLTRSMGSSPGQKWNYSGGCTQLLASIIEKTTGKPIDQFANEYLFKPLGITKFSWQRYPGTTMPIASGGLRLRSRDMLKIALLYSNKGNWEKNQILPAKWIEDSFQSHIKCNGQDNGKEYGYQFWIRHDTISNKPFKIVAAQGNGDQRIYFDRTHRLLVIFTAGNYNNENSANDSYAVLQDYIFTSLMKK